MRVTLCKRVAQHYAATRRRVNPDENVCERYERFDRSEVFAGVFGVAECRQSQRAVFTKEEARQSSACCNHTPKPRGKFAQGVRGGRRSVSIARVADCLLQQQKRQGPSAVRSPDRREYLASSVQDLKIRQSLLFEYAERD